MLSEPFLARLTAADIPDLELLEPQISLSFWGVDNYRRFLHEGSEYFGAKAVLLSSRGRREFAGFYLARAILEDLEILKVGVAPRSQRQGIGSTLMESAYAEGLRRGCSRCFLEVRKSNRGAIEFYYRQYFRTVGTRQNYYRNPVEDAWVMERRL